MSDTSSGAPADDTTPDRVAGEGVEPPQVDVDTPAAPRVPDGRLRFKVTLPTGSVFNTGLHGVPPIDTVGVEIPEDLLPDVQALAVRHGVNVKEA